MTTTQFRPHPGCQRPDSAGSRLWLSNCSRCLVSSVRRLVQLRCLFRRPAVVGATIPIAVPMAVVLVATTFADMVTVAPTTGPASLQHARRPCLPTELRLNPHGRCSGRSSMASTKYSALLVFCPFLAQPSPKHVLIFPLVSVESVD